MSEKKIRDFAKTPHSDVPKKVNEAIANPEGVNDIESPKLTQMQKKVVLKQTNNAREESRSIIKRVCGGNEKDALIFIGSGATVIYMNFNTFSRQ